MLNFQTFVAIPAPSKENPICLFPLYCIIIGYEQFGLMRSDPALCFKAMCGEEPYGSKKKKKRLAKKALAAAKRVMAFAKSAGTLVISGEDGEDSEGSENEDESEGEGEEAEDEDSGPPIQAIIPTNIKR